MDGAIFSVPQMLEYLTFEVRVSQDSCNYPITFSRTRVVTTGIPVS